MIKGLSSAYYATTFFSGFNTLEHLALEHILLDWQHILKDKDDMRNSCLVVK